MGAEHRATESEFPWQALVTGPPALTDLHSKLERINHDVPVHLKACIGLISTLSAATANSLRLPSTLSSPGIDRTCRLASPSLHLLLISRRSTVCLKHFLASILDAQVSTLSSRRMMDSAMKQDVSKTCWH